MASAGEVASATSVATMIIPGTIASSTPLDFGSIVTSATPGTVTLGPAGSATCTASAGLIRVGNCTAARFDGRVRLLFALQLTPPPGNAIDIEEPGGASMRVDNFTFQPGAGLLNFGANRFLILNLDGSYSFYTGGTLHVGANQPPGVYVGTFELQLNYN